MAIVKSNLNINFAQGLDTKTDPFQISPGRFLTLTNTVFQNGFGLQKRNGFGNLGALPDSASTFITTFNDNLTAVGTSLLAYNAGPQTWVNKGAFKSCEFETLPLVRSAINQSYADAAVASNGLVCTVFADSVPNSTGTTTTTSYKYVIADSVTGQNIVAPAAITPSAGAVTYAPKVFAFGNYFIIMFNTVITAVNHLEFVSININTLTVGSAVDISGNTYTAASTGTFDAAVMGNNLYVAWNGNDGGGAIRVTSIDTGLAVSSVTTTYATYVATQVSVCADAANSTVYVTFYDSVGKLGYVAALDSQLNKRYTNPAKILDGGQTVVNLTAAAYNGVCRAFWEYSNTYGGAIGSVHCNYVITGTVTQGGAVSATTTVCNSVGLASKAFVIGSTYYVMTTFVSTYQPTYFLMDYQGNVLCRFAYQNGGGLLATGLPNVTVTDTVAQIPYLVKDLIASVNKGTGSGSGAQGLGTTTQTAGIYSQTGVNLASFTVGTSNIQSVEIGGTLNLSGGFLWMFDGLSPVEQNFFLYPEPIGITTATTTGTMTAQVYYYQVTYEWADNNGNIHRSAPSIPVIADLSGSGTATNKVTIQVPTLRVTYKTVNKPRIVIYRWSTAQQAYYQVTSLTSPLPNDTSVDSISFVDTLPDTTIIGNNLLYTTGGVVEDVGTPPTAALALFQSRLVMIDAEDPNTLWFSKQVIQATPVEMSDLLTIYIAPTTGAQGSTGPAKVLSVMDDKLIIMKKDALYYINGSGPDNTGANNQFSEATFIGSTVGCDNARSVVLTPNGLMFQSDKGIWLLGRDLSTSYIGAPVEAYNNDTVNSAVCIPGTNQVRFTLDSGVTLMYDYYYNQWGTFTNVPAISSTLYGAKHTYLTDTGVVRQETPGAYLDGGTPVTMGFTTGWMNLMGLQGYERAYFFYLLGTYLSPHKISLQIAYDYAPTASQSVLISPNNYNATYGNNDGLYGSGDFGGNPALEQWRVFFSTQKCQAFRISMQEMYDASAGGSAGAGLTLSGLNLVVGGKKSYKPQAARTSAG